MFTSRAEFRLTLRADNCRPAPDRSGYRPRRPGPVRPGPGLDRKEGAPERRSDLRPHLREPDPERGRERTGFKVNSDGVRPRRVRHAGLSGCDAG
ncbi:hypothetical protein ACRAWD_16955 [Caulobacter segnis]